MILEDLESWVLLCDRVKRQEEKSAGLFNSLSFPSTFDSFAQRLVHRDVGLGWLVRETTGTKG